MNTLSLIPNFLARVKTKPIFSSFALDFKYVFLILDLIFIYCLYCIGINFPLNFFALKFFLKYY